MDISKFDLDGLKILHLSFLAVKKSHEIYLQERFESRDFTQIEGKALQTKINFFLNTIRDLEDRIREVQEKIPRFSVEYVNWHFGLLKKSFQVQFLPTSDAFRRYGPYVTGVAVFEPEEMAALMAAVQNGDETDGRIFFQEPIDDHLTEEQKAELRIHGFMASDIDTILWV